MKRWLLFLLEVQQLVLVLLATTRLQYNNTELFTVTLGYAKISIRPSPHVHHVLPPIFQPLHSQPP